MKQRLGSIIHNHDDKEDLQPAKKKDEEDKKVYVMNEDKSDEKDHKSKFELASSYDSDEAEKRKKWVVNILAYFLNYWNIVESC